MESAYKNWLSHRKIKDEKASRIRHKWELNNKCSLNKIECSDFSSIGNLKSPFKSEVQRNSINRSQGSDKSIPAPSWPNVHHQQWNSSCPHSTQPRSLFFMKSHADCRTGPISSWCDRIWSAIAGQSQSICDCSPNGLPTCRSWSLATSSCPKRHFPENWRRLWGKLHPLHQSSES